MLARSSRLLLALGIVLVGCRPTAPAQPPTTEPAADVPASAAIQPPAEPVLDAETLEPKLDEFLGSFGRNWGEGYAFSGFVLVAEKGQPVYAKGFGYANYERRRRPNIDTTFRIGSVTKQFTATAILELEERGKLSVTDPVSRYFPGWPRGDEITIHHLLTHTSGVWSYTNAREIMEDEAGRFHSTQEMLALFRDHPMDFEPGERFAYSNSGYVLLGAIIEEVTGQSYAEAMHDLVFEPAGLSRTWVGDGDTSDNGARGYSRSPAETREPARPIHMSVPHAAGSVRSTPRDLLRWHDIIESGEILEAASLKKLYTPQEANYAYGWVVREDEGRTTIGHDGGIFGFTTTYLRMPDDDVVIVAWTNDDNFNLSALRQGVAVAAYGGTPEPPAEPQRDPIEASLRSALAGAYTMADSSRRVLKVAGLPEALLDDLAHAMLRDTEGALVLEPGSLPAAQLFRSGPEELGTKGDVTVTWAPPGADGKVPSFNVRQGALAVIYQRDAPGVGAANTPGGSP